MHLGCLPLQGMTDEEFARDIGTQREIFEKYHNTVRATVDAAIKAMAEGGCYDPRVVWLPTFATVNVVNSLVVTPPEGNSVILRPNTFYEPFEAVIRQRLRDVENIPINTLPLATGQGNLHCATNVITDGYAKRP